MAMNFDFSNITNFFNKSSGAENQAQGQASVPKSPIQLQMPSFFARKTHLEINLVPDIKGEMIKALKLRNLILFLCIVVASASVGVTLVFGIIAGGQQIAIDTKQDAIKELSGKISSYSDLNDFLTIKDQVGNIATLTNDKRVFSRTFNILSSLIPTGADSITISKLNVTFENDQPTYSFEAQANAGTDPFIDYRVLESFKKSMDYMHYDYGEYVDKAGNRIPAYCMIETGNDGATFRDPERGIYAYWTINEDSCNPSETIKISDYETEDYDNNRVVRVWRTPQFSDWYKESEPASGPYMDLSGNISGVPHFNSQCITYTGDNSQNSANPTWSDNISDSCKLVPEGANGISISESSNGRDSDNELVLRFSATLILAPEVYQFNNFHMLTIPPSNRVNVTDSYVQVQAMFGKRAEDCKEGDTACSSSNTGSDSNNNSSNNSNNVQDNTQDSNQNQNSNGRNN